MLNIDDRLIKEVLPKIEPNGLAVLLAVAIHINHETEVAFPSNERLQKLTGLGRNSVEAALRCLRENGLLVSHQDKQKGKFGKRFLSVTTDFISIFVSVKKAKPFTDLGGTVDGGTAEPSTVNRGANYIKQEKEQINQFEEIKKGNIAGADAPLFPPFKKIGEVQLEEKEKDFNTGAGGGPTIVKLYDNQLPGVVVVDSIPPQPMTSPETTGREQQKREQKEKEISLATRVISYLNEKAGRSFRVNADANAKGIIARAREGFTEDEMRTVIDFKVAEWGKDTKFYQYLNPDTLFRPSHFEAYLQAAKADKPKSQQQNTRSQINHFGGESQRYDEKQAF